MIGRPGKATYSIREMSRLSGLSSDRIRAWELRYGLLNPRREPSGYRTYVAEDLRLLLVVKRKLESGETIGSVADRGRKALLAAEAAPKPLPDERMAAALQASLRSVRRGDMRATSQAIDEASGLAHADEFFRSFARPLLVEVGDLWALDALPIWMEHYVTGHVRRRLEALWAAEEVHRGPVAILFCPEGELHEIPLLGVAARLRTSGYKPVILGPHLPVESAIRAAEAHHAALAAVSVTYLTTPAAARTLGEELAALSKKVPVFVGGRSAKLYRKELEAAAGVRVVTFDDLEQLVPTPARTRRAMGRRS